MRRFEHLEDRRLLALFLPSKDNTLYEHAEGLTSNATGQYLFAGMTRRTTDPPLRRATLAFDLSSIPAGSTVTGATLRLVVTRNPMESLVMHDFTLHRLTHDWGEGTSRFVGDGGGLGTAATAGDATWLHAFFNGETWTTPGGDFAATASATAAVGNDGAVATWSSPGLVADVQAWVNSPGGNFGWIIVGDEGMPGTARRFFSREGATPPSLDITFTAAASPAVTNLVPAAASHAAPASTNIAATFDQDLNPATATPSSFVAHSAQSGQLAAAVTTAGTTITLDPTSTLFPGERVLATATGGIQAVGGQPVTPHVWQFRAATTAGSGVFVDSGQSIFGATSNTPRSYGVQLGDLDGDGDLDAAVANSDYTDNRIYLNNGGVFTDNGQSLANSSSWALELGDVDGDGDLDIFTANTDGAAAANRIWLNDGSGRFSDSGQLLGNHRTRGAALGDLDGDGDLDAWTANANQGNRVWLNVGGGVLNDSGQAIGGVARLSQDVELGDLDGDGDLDAFEVNANGQGSRVFLNDGAGVFSDTAQSLGSGNSQAVDLGDLDGDGDLDAVVANAGGANQAWLNDGAGSMTPAAALGDHDSRAVALGDFDADGDLDAFFANKEEANRLWLNNGNAGFSDTGQQMITGSGDSWSVAAGDVDADGDLDVLVGNLNNDNRLWLNETEPTFRVTSLEGNSSGFRARFNADLDDAALNLGDTQAGGLGPADLVVTGASTGPVSGSFTVTPRELTFIQSGGPLSADTYTVELRSADNGFKDLAGNHLDGDADGTAGGDFSGTFTIAAAAANAVTLGIGDFVRGPGQPINLPADTSDGIPISIRIPEGTAVKAIDFRVAFDAELLQVTDAAAGAGLPAGALVTLNNLIPGVAIVSISTTANLPAGTDTIVSLAANVPEANASQIYGTAQILDVHAATVSDGADNEHPVVVDDGLHLAAFAGDVSGNGRINFADPTLIARLATQLDTTLAAFPTVDFGIVADVSGNARGNLNDATLVAQFAASIPVPAIPPLPPGVVITAGGNGKWNIAAGPEVSVDTVPNRDTERRRAPVATTPTGVDFPRSLDQPAVDLAMRDSAEPREESRRGLEEAMEELLPSQVRAKARK